MPLLEAPAEYFESSPEHSLQPELPLLLAAPGPAALAQVQPRLAQQQNNQQQRTTNARRPLHRNNSFDRDIPVAEEPQHMPAFVHLLPVVLPVQAPEPTIDEMLRRVTQRNDLENVDTVRLRVISYTMSLSRLSLFLPRLQQLDLSGSVLSSLRDLGYGLLHLNHLNISNCGLNSFDGTSGLPAIRVLIADGNMIQRVGPLSELSHLQRLSARNNRISELGLLSFLGLCPNLLDVELRGNPVCRLSLYRSTLARCVPTLETLDGLPMAENGSNSIIDETLTTRPNDEEEHTSLSSDISSDAESATEPRPATAPHNTNSSNAVTLRPASAAVLVSLDTAIQRQTSIRTTPVTGSVLGLVRQRRRRSGHAWLSSSSSSSSSYSSANSTQAPSLSSCSSNSSLDIQSSSYAFNAQSTLN